MDICTKKCCLVSCYFLCFFLARGDFNHDAMFDVAKKVLDRYKEPFTMLDIGFSGGYYSFIPGNRALLSRGYPSGSTRLEWSAMQPRRVAVFAPYRPQI